MKRMIASTLLLLLAWSGAPATAQPVAQTVTIEATGSITANGGTVTVLTGRLGTAPPGGFGTAAIGLYGTFTGTFQFEGSVNCSSYESVRATPPGTTTAVTSTTATGTWLLPVAGLQCVRVRASAAVTGTATVTIRGGTTVGSTAVGAEVAAVTPGTSATSLGKAENAPLASGDTGVFALGVVDATNTTQRAAAGQYSQITVDEFGVLLARSDHPRRFHCTVTVSTAVTIQAVGGSCVAPGAGLSLYVTDVYFSASASGILADAFPTLKYGTGGTCGAGTAVFWQALTAAAIVTQDNRTTPIKVPANNEICWITTTAGSKAIQISGFIAP